MFIMFVIIIQICFSIYLQTQYLGFHYPPITVLIRRRKKKVNFSKSIINISYKEEMKPKDPNDGDIEYEYFRDHEGKVKRFRKPDYKPRPGFVRLKFLEKYYIWWRGKSFDFKMAILPWFLGFFGVFVIYQVSMIWSQNDLERQIKAKLPFQYNSEVYKEMKKLQKQGKHSMF